MDPIPLFFAFGILAGLLKIDIGFSKSTNRLLIFLLLITIGMKGGVELEHVSLWSILPEVILVAGLGLILPVVAFPVLRRFGRLSRIDAAAFAAHYGSVSVGTFAVCMAYLERQQVSVEPYVAVFVVVLEIPAILVGLIMAQDGHSMREPSGASWVGSLRRGVASLSGVVRSEAVYLLLGGLVIGRFAGEARLEPFAGFFFDLFSGVLALFLVEMGLTVSQQIEAIRKNSLFLVSFGVLMPLLGGGVAMALGSLLELSLGGVVVLTTLGASASYIAVPAAMRSSLPNANVGLSLGSSLGVTFPFNVVLGIPLFHTIAQRFAV